MADKRKGSRRLAASQAAMAIRSKSTMVKLLAILALVIGGLHLLRASCNLFASSRSPSSSDSSAGFSNSSRIPKRLFINYAHNCCYVGQRTSCQAALQHGADRCIQYNHTSLDPDFTSRNNKILSLPRGAGYWVWKPYLILKTLLEEMEDGDLLLYADADSTTNGDLSALYGLAAAGGGESYASGGIVDGLVSRMALNDGDDSDGAVKDIIKWSLSQQEVHLFQFPPNFVEACWTKMDAFLLLNCTDESVCMKSAQADAGFSGWRRGRQSIQFAAQWLGYMEDPRVSTDLPNQLATTGTRSDLHIVHACTLAAKEENNVMVVVESTEEEAVYPSRNPNFWLSKEAEEEEPARHQRWRQQRRHE
ncbi:unnamed protein product [Closterium sp. Yama58-4]|nr:unnamed protein product [Closterium sp. Yama58-4]